MPSAIWHGPASNQELTTTWRATMPTYQYEAMDHTGREVKDSIDAATQEEAHDRQALDQAALHLHPPALDASGRRPADPPQPEDPRGPEQAGGAQERA